MFGIIHNHSVYVYVGDKHTDESVTQLDLEHVSDLVLIFAANDNI